MPQNINSTSRKKDFPEQSFRRLRRTWVKYLAFHIHLPNAFVTKWCQEYKGQKPMRENGIKIASHNGMEGKENRKTRQRRKGGCFKYDEKHTEF
jgi:hypothetical protein